MTTLRSERSLRHPLHRTGVVGFTLVELMVAVTGGLFVAIMVFTLARDGARFYQREARVADATLSAALGFERLRADIARAGYLSTSNVQLAFQRRRLCGMVNTAYPRLAGLGSVQIQPDTWEGALSTELSANGISPDTIVLSGAYGSAESFIYGSVDFNGGAGYTVYLQSDIGAAARLGFANGNANAATMSDIFPAGRAVRLVNQTGEYQFGTIVGTAVAAGVASITLAANSNIPTRLSPQAVPCDFSGTGEVNVVNLVRYRLGNLRNDARYAPLYQDPNPWDATRSDLIRDELDTSGNRIAGSEEIVAEYAVDLKFGVTYVNAFSANNDPSALQTILPGQNAAGLGTLMGLTNSGPAARPQDARAIRARLSVRSREPDRQAPIAAGPDIAPGLYRIGLGQGATAPFARVRTQQADVALNNQMEIGR